MQGFPTIKFFPAGKDKTPIEYNKQRDGDAFVAFLNEHCGTQRTLEGGLSAKVLCCAGSHLQPMCAPSCTSAMIY